jgi:hypothetical protein
MIAPECPLSHHDHGDLGGLGLRCSGFGGVGRLDTPKTTIEGSRGGADTPKTTFEGCSGDSFRARVIVRVPPSSGTVIFTT